MLSIEFIQYVFENLSLYLFTLIIYTGVYYYLVRKYIYTISDPLFMNTIFSSFGGAIVFFMFFKDLISFQYFLSYILTQTAFVFGFRFFKPIDFNKLIPTTDKNNKPFLSSLFITRLYIAASLVYIVSQLIVYKVGGIPLFYKTRLEFYVSDTGFGVFSRIIYVTSLITTYLLIHRFNNWKGHIFLKSYDVFVLINVAVNLVLSGSKSAFLTIVFMTFYYSIFSLKISGNLKYFNKIKKYQYAMLIFAFIVAISVTLIQDMGQYGENVGLIAFVNRLVLSGDVYVNAYPNAVIENMEWHNPILVIFQDFLGLSRLVSWENLPGSLGIELYRYFVPNADMVGPNSRHNIFGYVYFGFYGSILFSFCIGYLLSFVRNKLYFICKPTTFAGLLYMLVSFPVSLIESDIGLTMGYLDNTLLILIPLVIVVYIVDKGSMSPNEPSRLTNVLTPYND